MASSIRFVFAGCKIIAFLSNQSDTLFMLFCNSFWTVAVFLSDAFSDVSSANISQFTEPLVICKGRSLIRIQRRRGPRIGLGLNTAELRSIYQTYDNQGGFHSDRANGYKDVHYLERRKYPVLC